MVKIVTAILFVFILALTGQASAGQAEVRDVALSNNCPPKKIEIYKQSVGNGPVIYRVQCTLPKTVGTAESTGKAPDALLIGCTQNLCDVLQPVNIETK